MSIISDDQYEIEHVIEGGEPGNMETSDKENDNEEEKNVDGIDKNKDKEKIRKRFGPRIVLNADRLKGPRGIGIMESFFSDIKLHGKGKEREDLNLVMQRLEHWTHRLMPRMQFDDSLKKIEKLGTKKEVSNYVKRIRLGMEEDDDVPRDMLMDEAPDSPPPPLDPFDQLLNSSVSHHPGNTDMTAEQRDQMLRNRLIAEERRAARIKKAQEMKENFKAKLTLTSQTVTSQTVDSIVEGQNDLSQDNNENHMEIDRGIELAVEEFQNCKNGFEENPKNQLDIVDEPGLIGETNKNIPECLEKQIENSSDLIIKKSESKLEALSTRNCNTVAISVEMTQTQTDIEHSSSYAMGNERSSAIENNENQSNILTVTHNNLYNETKTIENTSDDLTEKNLKQPDISEENFKEFDLIEHQKQLAQSNIKQPDQEIQLTQNNGNQPGINEVTERQLLQNNEKQPDSTEVTTDSQTAQNKENQPDINEVTERLLIQNHEKQPDSTEIITDSQTAQNKENQSGFTEIAENKTTENNETIELSGIQVKQINENEL